MAEFNLFDPNTFTTLANAQNQVEQTNAKVSQVSKNPMSIFTLLGGGANPFSTASGDASATAKKEPFDAVPIVLLVASIILVGTVLYNILEM
jgi:hypothetical protein